MLGNYLSTQCLSNQSITTYEGHVRNKRLLPGYRKHSVPIRYSYSFFLLIFSNGHGLLLAWEDDPKIDGLGEVKEVPKSWNVECVYTCA